MIVAATGARELLADCLRSVARHPPSGGPTRTWVVDNATADGTTGMLASEFPWVATVRLERVASFAAANNAVLRRVTAPHALLLNPDTELSAGALDRALAALGEGAERAVVGVRLVRRDGSFDHAAKRSFPTLVGALGHFTGLGRRPGASGALAQYRAPEVDERGAGPVDAVNGAFMLVRTSAMREVGLLDEGYRLYGEDLDWCYRFQAAGWTVWYDGGVTVVHVKGGATVREHGRGRHRDLRLDFAFHHAMARFYRKFRAGPRPLVDALVYAGLAGKFALSALLSALARRRAR
ncbi:MAG TPA: glycosyltransferase family 2 protein [Solirubrobacteraceae bacterium]|nr:glycosyltransferase family 2 protein [Solirubrobacteraceae bacterium]